MKWYNFDNQVNVIIMMYHEFFFLQTVEYNLQVVPSTPRKPSDTTYGIWSSNYMGASQGKEIRSTNRHDNIVIHHAHTFDIVISVKTLGI